MDVVSSFPKIKITETTTRNRKPRVYTIEDHHRQYQSLDEDREIITTPPGQGGGQEDEESSSSSSGEFGGGGPGHWTTPRFGSSRSFVKSPSLPQFPNSKGTSSEGQPSWNRFFQCFTSPLNVFNSRQGNKEQDNHKKDDGPQTIPEEIHLSPHPHRKSPCPSPNLPRIMTDSDLYLQELADSSEILEREDTKNLGKHFPPRAIGCSWEKIFSTSDNGFSLHNLYRKMDGVDSHVLFIVEDIEGRVFGAMLSCPLKVSENFYGTCDTFLFRCRPDFAVFKWSGSNFYFIQGQDNFISVGSDDGKFGLWLDDNLYMGRTEACSTFNSPALVPERDFKVKTVEAWVLGLF